MTGPDTDALWVAPANTTVVRLTIANTRLEDAGTYTCAPENMVHDNIRLSISQGEREPTSGDGITSNVVYVQEIPGLLDA